jgi:hypothetical protein
MIGEGMSVEHVMQHIKNHIMYDSNTDCWVWTGSVREKGYPVYTLEYASSVQVRYNIRRVMYELYKGPIEQGLLIHPKCENKRCINPEHLLLWTKQQVILAGNGISAQHAKKTHCPQGHRYSKVNTYVNPIRGGRACKQCNTEKQLIRQRFALSSTKQHDKRNSLPSWHPLAPPKSS